MECLWKHNSDISLLFIKIGFLIDRQLHCCYLNNKLSITLEKGYSPLVNILSIFH